jgi:cytidyltransferase-like protein
MKTVITFGTFDITHKGHIDYLTQAKKHGDFLITIIARDINIKPNCIHSEQERKQAVEKLAIADLVVLGDKKDKLNILKKYNPDIICLGYDQKANIAEIAKASDAQIIRLKSFKPEIYKSSILKKQLHENSCK